MTGQEYQELGRAVAVALGFEWSYQPPRYPDEVPTYAEIRGPEGCGVRICKDWNGGARISVHGLWPEQVKDLDDRPHDFTPDPRDRPKEITCALNRGAPGIAADIRRRYLPEYLPLWRKQVNQREITIARYEATRRAYTALAEIVGTNEPHNGKLHVGSAMHGGYWGTVELSAYGEMDATIELRHVSFEQVRRILAVLREA